MDTLDFIIFVLAFILLFVVGVSNLDAGAQGERERIKDAIVNNVNITCTVLRK